MTGSDWQRLEAELHQAEVHRLVAPPARSPDQRNVPGLPSLDFQGLPETPGLPKDTLLGTCLEVEYDKNMKRIEKI